MVVARAYIKWSLAAIILVLTVASINCVSGSQQAINNSTLEPTSIIVVATPDKIIAGGNGNSIIIAQLYNNGEPLRRASLNVTGTFENSSMATIDSYNVTDDNGTTCLSMSSNMTPGRVKVTVSYWGNRGVISNFTYVNISNWGKIGGIAFDKNGFGIPSANVSLWSCHYNGSSHQWERDDVLKIPENPQLSNDGRTAPTGLFAFYYVPVGNYMVVAEKKGDSNIYNNSSIINIDQGTGTCLITLSDYDMSKEHYTPKYLIPMKIPSPTINGSTIWGIVCDDNKESIPNANVSLWHCEYNQSTGIWEKTTIVVIPGNPQRADDGKTGALGQYQFDGLPAGTYYVTAYIHENYGYLEPYYAIVHLNGSLANSFIVLPYQEQPILPPSRIPT
jgi:hypothetical protein